MMGTDFHLIDIYCNFKHPNGELNVIRYHEFIETFLLFLESNNLITFKQLPPVEQEIRYSVCLHPIHKKHICNLMPPKASLRD